MLKNGAKIPKECIESKKENNKNSKPSKSKSIKKWFELNDLIKKLEPYIPIETQQSNISISFTNKNKNKNKN